MQRSLCRCARAATRSIPRHAVIGRRACFSTASIMRQTDFTPTESPVSRVLPSDAFQLLPEASKVAAEDALYQAEINQVKDWWSSPRYKDIKRPYTADDVVSKRGAMQQTYPSSLMARKLFNLLEERNAAGQPVHTSQQPASFEPASLTALQWEP
ncbi:hypothetical protein MRB53_039036 [Persea americana]|nr:hypothetical protein MRB53_039036 [Persea americana]